MILQVVGDESGSDGENLSSATHRTFSYGTTALSIAEAQDVVVQTREALGSTKAEARQGSELKASKLFKKHRTVAESLFLPGGPLAATSSVYLADKAKFLAGKMISLLVEEHESSLGTPPAMHIQGYYADEMTDQILPALDESTRAELLSSFNALCKSYKVPFAPTGRADRFIRALRLANVAGSHNRRASRMLGRLWDARHEAYAIEGDDSATLDLDPMLPTMLVVATTWHNRFHGAAFEMYIDEYRQLTPLMFEIIKSVASSMYGVRLQDIVQINSATDPRVQLADWIAGAGRIAAGEVLSGTPSRLSDLVRPLIDPDSMRSPDSALQRWLDGGSSFEA
ncbi:hypothetical protein [Frondihabitans peucedani]|uniref:DUF3800 domain-containing protein n=1 Tax=Frondihabitans peucedani TaxID=598626 RepID=A0ABP8E1F3_9MICO